MLVKSMHQIARIEFRNANFPRQGGSAPLRPLPGGASPGPPPGGKPPGPLFFH